MKYVVAILVIVTILHDISLWRLNHKVDVLTDFFDKTLRKLEEYTTEQSGKEQQMKLMVYLDIDTDDSETSVVEDVEIAIKGCYQEIHHYDVHVVDEWWKD